MSVPQFARFIHLLVCILALKAAAVFAGASAPEIKYGWKPGEVYRYDYSKSVSITEASTDADPGTREFKFEGVLILEVNGKVSNGVKAVLRFDSPKMILPEGFWFSPQADDPVPVKEKTKAIGRAMETAIKLARWSVTLDFDGTMHIDSRMPKSLDEWQKEVKDAGNWKGKYRKDWVALVEENLGLVASGDDRELLLAMSVPPVATAAEMTKIRPYRSAPTLVSSQEEIAQYSFKRMAPPQAGQGYAIPNMPVTMTFNPTVKTTKGAAAFDTKLNILDSLSEEYVFEADYTTNAKPIYTLHQQVTVKYELIRRSRHKPPDEVDAR